MTKADEKELGGKETYPWPAAKTSEPYSQKTYIDSGSFQDR